MLKKTALPATIASSSLGHDADRLRWARLRVPAIAAEDVVRVISI